MKHDDIKIGEYYNVNWPNLPKPQLIFVIGRDPFTGKLVATCTDWKICDFLKEDDFDLMEPI